MRTTTTMNPGCVIEHWFSPAFAGGAVYFPSCPRIPLLGSEVGVLASQTISPSLKNSQTFGGCALQIHWCYHPQTSFDPIFQRLSPGLTVPPPVAMDGRVSIHLTINLLLLSFSPPSPLPFSPELHAEPYYQERLHLLNH